MNRQSKRKKSRGERKAKEKREKSKQEGRVSFVMLTTKE
jgi:hypothetical protein